MDPRLSVRVRPCHLPMSVNFKASIWQLKAEIQQRSRSLWFSRENVHAGFAQIKQNALGFASVRQRDFHRSLHGNAVSAPAFAIQQRGYGAQAGFGFVIGKWLVQHEVRAVAENRARLCGLRNQGHADGRVARIQPAGLVQHLTSSVGVVEVNHQSIEPLLLQTVDRGSEIAETLHHDPHGRQNPAQDLGGRIVSRNQQCQKGHNKMLALQRRDYGQRGAAGRAALDAAAPEPDAPALAAMLSEVSSTSINTALSSSSFSASRGATSRSFSAACWSISICFPSAAYLVCFCRNTS